MRYTIMTLSLLLLIGCDSVDTGTENNTSTYSSVVYTINSLKENNDAVNIDVTIDGEKEHQLTYERPLAFTQSSDAKTIDLFYTKTDINETLGSETVDNTGVYIYAATECSFQREHLLDTVDDNNTIRFINLTRESVPASEITIKKDNLFIANSIDAEGCAVSTMSYTPSTNGTWVFTYAGEEIGRTYITDDAAIAVIIYDTTDKIAKVLRLDTYDDLIPACP